MVDLDVWITYNCQINYARKWACKVQKSMAKQEELNASPAHRLSEEYGVSVATSMCPINAAQVLS